MNLLIRADASVAIGTGHVMRCLALAQAWQDVGGKVTFAMAESTPAIEVRLAAESCELFPIRSEPGSTEDAGEMVAFARERRAHWVVVDGYCFTAKYQEALRDAGFKILFLDDYGHAEHYYADVVLNQNVHANETLYKSREHYTRLLLGPAYCLLRREFAVWRSWERKIAPEVHKVLVTMGGSDAANLSARVIEAIERVRLESLTATLVVGGSSPHFESLQKAAAKANGEIRVLRDVSNLAELMSQSDVAISAAGSTCWELCLLGLPSLLIDVAPNQTAVAREMHAKGCAIHVGNSDVSAQQIAEQLGRLLDSQALRESLSQHARGLVDGKGAERVASALRGAEGLRLRRAKSDDSRLLWEWANDAEVRAASFSSDPISWETHTPWLENKLGQKGCVIFLAEDEACQPCGQIRFESRPDGDWEIDVSVAKPKRGQGLAARLIETGVRMMRTEKHGNARFHAFVKPGNQASVRAFEGAGFKQIGSEQVCGNAAIHLVCQKKPAQR